MHRFYLAPDAWPAAALTGSEAHHARSVLRMQPGDRAVLFDGRGREGTAEIVSLDSGTVHLRVLQEAVTPPLRARITLAQAIPKGKNMDLIVQKAVEIGAAEIFPLLSDRTVVQLDPESAAQKQAKWQTVALEAAKQCGQNWLPHVHQPRTPEAFFRDLPPAPLLFLILLPPPLRKTKIGDRISPLRPATTCGSSARSSPARST